MINHVADLFEKHGSNIWFEQPAEALLPQGFTHPDSPNNRFTKETDIMDVWFDSGTSHHGAMIDRGLPYPADLYLEGSDQYRGWFNSSLTTGVATMGKSPYKTVVSHGFVLDGEGRKMSKSLGNVIDPNKISSTLGADIFRMWVSSVAYQSDVRISDELLNQVAEIYRKVRNTLKFLLGNLARFQSEHRRRSRGSNVGNRPLSARKDRSVHQRLPRCVSKNTASTTSTANSTILSPSFLLSIWTSRKTFFTSNRADDPKRRAIQTVMQTITNALLTLLNPILPHTTTRSLLRTKAPNRRRRLFARHAEKARRRSRRLSTNTIASWICAKSS
ncbi:MAG: class I tRNA ligase family protein [Bacillus subtilis]|nr:class I tRNA ligase family protein [Bacillus subtilis]